MPTTNAPRFSANGTAAVRKTINKKRPSNPKSTQRRSQVDAESRLELLCPSDYGVEIGGRRTFNWILISEKRENIESIKARAFAANQMAKSSNGRARTALYRVKNNAISALFSHGAAFINSTEVVISASREAEIGVSFAGGGGLHTRASLLDPEAQQVIRRQLANKPRFAALVFRFVDANKRCASIVRP
jgi:hypothetical protein